MDLELKDKVAVITGGSVGIGLAVAEGLAKCMPRGGNPERVRYAGLPLRQDLRLRRTGLSEAKAPLN